MGLFAVRRILFPKDAVLDWLDLGFAVIAPPAIIPPPVAILFLPILKSSASLACLRALLAADILAAVAVLKFPP